MSEGVAERGREPGLGWHASYISISALNPRKGCLTIFQNLRFPLTLFLKQSWEGQLVKIVIKGS